MDAYKTHGAFSWSELLTRDPGRATEFYGTLFGWKIETMDMPQGAYHVLKVGDTSVGGIMKIPAESEGLPPNWCPYVTVDDVDATVKRCTQLGGSVLMPPTDIPSVGRFAVIKDPQGAALNVITYVQG
jgi:predicted enzyme related to lactoylglutathione lyase